MELLDGTASQQSIRTPLIITLEYAILGINITILLVAIVAMIRNGGFEHLFIYLLLALPPVVFAFRWRQFSLEYDKKKDISVFENRLLKYRTGIVLFSLFLWGYFIWELYRNYQDAAGGMGLGIFIFICIIALGSQVLHAIITGLKEGELYRGKYNL